VIFKADFLEKILIKNQNYQYFFFKLQFQK